ncbi:holo-[acyl-carrier-protein] synthase [Amphibacillus marinus]|uniref:Holo-[acyl-carrier-protein] synthase n=1 Tax=Amphibacillus marinus TaxID=872970 RepID=A0A1H8JPE3_9BACI|nr:holo-ACP synthase [Amphibacillus marinus]SEN82431.1 holo-[acyl-carrier-protein] synthase [Amphibacillus marinus]
MILGTGIDIVELIRVEQLLRRQPRFIKKILTDREQVLFKTKQTNRRQLEFLAGRFAAKEAFAKAYGTGIGQVGFHDIEIFTNQQGGPYIVFVKNKDLKSHLSISHSKDYAIAQVILED